MKTYSTYREAIQNLVDAIEASGVVNDARAEYDIDAICYEILRSGLTERGNYAVWVDADPVAFWASVQRHAR